MADNMPTFNVDIDKQEAIEESNTPAYVVRHDGNTKAVAGFIILGINVNEKGTGGKTALQYAAENGNIDIVNILIDAGANPNLQDKRGNTPSSLCCELWSRKSRQYSY